MKNTGANIDGLPSFFTAMNLTKAKKAIPIGTQTSPRAIEIVIHIDLVL